MRYGAWFVPHLQVVAAELTAQQTALEEAKRNMAADVQKSLRVRAHHSTSFDLGCRNLANAFMPHHQTNGPCLPCVYRTRMQR